MSVDVPPLYPVGIELPSRPAAAARASNEGAEPVLLRHGSKICLNPNVVNDAFSAV